MTDRNSEGVSIEMLPLPKHSGKATDMFGQKTKLYSGIQMQEYARANMEPLLAENERLRAEVERLQKIVRPKREEECMTLDHWRMRAYDLEANWSRCSRACAGEQGKRKQAEARAERLAEALREAMEWNWLDDDARPSRVANLCEAALRYHDQEGGDA